ncbi:hypothetical protein GMES_2991 [Paraglaciecola mesophila KMM 241]|uniref:Uncharacterized protein n=1 Tax=Paraglaciecola mesophila KMM 241 TaxID=1128912 RepID=K6YMQ9_9ALTE|nr:hypothetical protein GMES_2991 [Paraglaciecola mesophila KMM 241]
MQLPQFASRSLLIQYLAFFEKGREPRTRTSQNISRELGSYI